MITNPQRHGSPRFLDLYSGCGGFSLGLMMAGWTGVLGIEKERHAFESLSRNLIYGSVGYKYEWPNWLPKRNLTVGTFARKYRKQILTLRGKVDLLIGGPPCQGFSMAGKRKKDDPRNLMFRHYIQIVSLIRPKLVVLENVRGIDIQFEKRSRNKPKRHSKPFSYRIIRALENIGYLTTAGDVCATNFGVPQNRTRYFIFGFDRQALGSIDPNLFNQDGQLSPFKLLNSSRIDFLKAKNLPSSRPVTVQEALSDLATAGRKRIECVDSPGFFQLVYTKPRSSYQRLLHGDLNGVTPNSMRLVNHRQDTVERFEMILRTCRKGVLLSQHDRDRLGLKKHATVPLAAHKPSHTLTTLPDDMLHYSEPRILTVRESARLQSFPDKFEFKGKYTTGGKKRVKECPRYTQVGNAVPPLVAEIIGLVLLRILFEIHPTRKSSSARRSCNAQAKKPKS